MIETERNFRRIKMEKLLGHSPIVIKPMFRITPEAFDAINVVSSFGFPLLFSDDDMISTKSERGVSIPVVSIIQAPWFRMAADQLSDNPILSPREREDSYNTITLKNTQNDDLPGSSPTAFSRAFSSESRFVAFNYAFKRLRTFLRDTQYFSDRSKKSLRGRPRCRPTESEPVSWYTPYKAFKELFLCLIRYTKRIPDTLEDVAGTTVPAFKSAIAQGPCPAVSTLWT